MSGVVRFFGWSLVLSLLLWKLAPVLGIDVGLVPGTITFQSGTIGIQIPLLFCLVTSVALTLIFGLIRKLRR